jgi:hypothetical protein
MPRVKESFYSLPLLVKVAKHILSVEAVENTEEGGAIECFWEQRGFVHCEILPHQ